VVTRSSNAHHILPTTRQPIFLHINICSLWTGPVGSRAGVNQQGKGGGPACGNHKIPNLVISCAFLSKCKRATAGREADWWARCFVEYSSDNGPLIKISESIVSSSANSLQTLTQQHFYLENYRLLRTIERSTKARTAASWTDRQPFNDFSFSERSSFLKEMCPFNV
jgi:hypothetical protein